MEFAGKVEISCFFWSGGVRRGLEGSGGVWEGSGGGPRGSKMTNFWWIRPEPGFS